MQFLLDPEAFPEIIQMEELFGPIFVTHIHYLTRTYAYYVYREKQILLGSWVATKKRTNLPKDANDGSSGKGRVLAQWLLHIYV